MDVKSGTLYLVGTPIGNLDDMTFRAIEVLKKVDTIAAEDTRHTGKLLHYFQISTPQISYHEHNRLARIPDLLARLRGGQSIALVTDAGMPCVSDPGYDLVKACAEAGLPVVPIPGVTAVITGLAASGVKSDRFTFEGFLPAKEKERISALDALRSETRTMIFYEAPHRIRESLKSMAEVFGGDRSIALARELTKLHEEFWRGSIGGAIAYYVERDPQGEYTVVVAGSAVQAIELSEERLKIEMVALLREGVSRSHISKQLALQTGLPKRQLYQWALELPDSRADSHAESE
jgi:16S rRNA (cytidine1402-2'-O)-methyltransferase